MFKFVSVFVSACLMLSSTVHAMESLNNDFDMTFVQIPAGSFVMGTHDIDEVLFEHPNPGKADVLDETPAHKVTLSNAFWMGQTEVTQSVWLQVMENRPGPEEFWQRDDWRDLPVTGINWFMAKRFVEELSKMDKSFDYRLPTEAEWEYAARAGDTGMRPVEADEMVEHAWYIHNSGDKPQPVATRQANAFGLYDMFGNVWEWLEDVYVREIYQSENRVDPLGQGDIVLRVRRGGSYHCPQHMMRFALRSADKPGNAYSVLGLRVIAMPK